MTQAECIRIFIRGQKKHSLCSGLETISCEDMLSQFDKLNIKNANWKPEGKPGQLTSELLELRGQERACHGGESEGSCIGGPDGVGNNDILKRYEDFLEGGVTPGLVEESSSRTSHMVEGGCLEGGHERACTNCPGNSTNIP
jgi:hypothetical protein